MDRRLLLAAGLVASLALTAVLWALGIPGFFFLLLLPFLWFGRRSGRSATPASCPTCAAGVEAGFTFCPRCGRRL